MAALTKSDKTNTIRALLMSDGVRSQIAMAAPKHLTPERVVRIAMTSIQKTPKLLDCTRESLLGSILTCAQIGLEPDDVSGRAYLVPYGTTCTLIIGYRGIMELARRSGEIAKLEAKCVYEGDEFAFAYGTEGFIKHVPKQREMGDKADVTYVYALTKLVNGETQFEVMTKAEVEDIRKRSKAGNSGPWVTDWPEMAKKTVMRRLCKYLPSSPDLQSAITVDEQADRGIPQSLEPIDVEIASPSEPKPEKALATAAKPKPDDELYKKLHAAAMALPQPEREKILGNHGCKIITDTRKMDAESANDLLVELIDAATEELPEPA